LIRYQDEGLNALASRHFQETTDRLVGHLRKRRRRARYRHEELTYLCLNQRANQLANHLRKMGVEPEVTVGICAERSAERMVGILGVLKARGAYVPLDPQAPREQLLYMLEDSSPAVLLTQESLLGRLPRCEIPTVCLDRDWVTVGEKDAGDLAAQTSAEDTACVIYTTDSGGKPKRVTITHAELSSLVVAQMGGPALWPEDRVLLQALRSFDPSFLQGLATLLSGATLGLIYVGGLFVLDLPVGLSTSPSLGSGQDPGNRSSDGLAPNRAAPDQAPSLPSRHELRGGQSHVG
jgi:non-ribosomal peptide synthetase component F